MTKRSEAVGTDFDSLTRKRILFAVTSPFAVNAFLVPHLKTLSKYFDIVLCVNLKAYPLSPEIEKLVKVIDVGFERKIALFQDLQTLIHLYFIIKRFNPQAIHTITPKAGLLAMLAGFFVGVPYRWHTFTGQVWVTRRSFSRSLLKMMDKLIVSLSTHVFTDSTSQSQFLQYEGVAPREKISTLGTGSIAGVDINRFHPDVSIRQLVRQELGVDEQVCVFLFVGRLVRDKGVFDLFTAFKILAERSSTVGLWMVGPDEEELTPNLRKQGLVFCQSTRWIGATLTPERYMMAADVLVLPSYREGFGSVIIEAGSCGLPVIAYKIAGVIDAIKAGVSGILVDLGQVDCLAEQLFALASDRQKRQTMGDSARKYIAQQFSMEEITNAWLVYYRNSLMND